MKSQKTSLIVNIEVTRKESMKGWKECFLFQISIASFPNTIDARVDPCGTPFLISLISDKIIPLYCLQSMYVQFFRYHNKKSLLNNI